MDTQPKPDQDTGSKQAAVETLLSPARSGQWLSALAQLSVVLVAATYGSGFVVVSASRSSVGMSPLDALHVQHAGAGVLFLVWAAQCAVVAWSWQEADTWAVRSGFWNWLHSLMREVREYCLLSLGAAFYVFRNLPPVMSRMLHSRAVRGMLLGLAADHIRLGRRIRRLMGAGAFWSVVLFLLPFAASCQFTMGFLVDELPVSRRFLTVAPLNAVTAAVLLVAAYALRGMRRRGMFRTPEGVQLAFPFLFCGAMTAAAFGHVIYPRVAAEFGGGNPPAVVICLSPMAVVPPLALSAFGLSQKGACREIRGQLLELDGDSITVRAVGSEAAVTIARDQVKFIIYEDGRKTKRGRSRAKLAGQP